MSLIINADDEFLSATGGSFTASGATGVTIALRVKRDSGSSATQAYAALANSLAAEYDSIVMGHNGSAEDCFTYPSGAARRINGSINTNSTAWQTLILVYKKDVELVVYSGIDGGTLYSHSNGSAPTDAFNNALSQIRIGGGVDTFSGWDSRCRIAQVAVWNTGLSSSQAAELFNGGTAGAGKNPQAVQNANLTFYAPLTSDATVTVGGVSLSATGTLTYDGSDNPNVEAYGGGSVDGAASGATLTGTSSLTAGGASGTASGTATGANLTGTSSISAGAATGNATGSFTTAAMENNSGAGLLASTSVAWTWYEGAIGSAPTSTTHGTGTTNGSGILTVTGLPVAAGFLLARTTDSSGVYYQSGTPA